jgi:hypothetical protein
MPFPFFGMGGGSSGDVQPSDTVPPITDSAIPTTNSFPDSTTNPIFDTRLPDPTQNQWGENPFLSDSDAGIKNWGGNSPSPEVGEESGWIIGSIGSIISGIGSILGSVADFFSHLFGGND